MGYPTCPYLICLDNSEWCNMLSLTKIYQWSVQKLNNGLLTVDHLDFTCATVLVWPWIAAAAAVYAVGLKLPASASCALLVNQVLQHGLSLMVSPIGRCWSTRRVGCHDDRDTLKVKSSYSSGSKTNKVLLHYPEIMSIITHPKVQALMADTSAIPTHGKLMTYISHIYKKGTHGWGAGHRCYITLHLQTKYKLFVYNIGVKHARWSRYINKILVSSNM